MNLRPLSAAILGLALYGGVPQAWAEGLPPTFTVHGVMKTCSAITQLDSALASGYQPFFSGWTERDYTDAGAWAEACSSYGWHVPDRPRALLLRHQRDMALGQAVASRTSLVAPPVSNSGPTSRRIKWGTYHELPLDGSDEIGFDATVVSHDRDTLPDIARRYGLGYEEINRANPGIDMWLPGEGTRILLPGRHRLPPGPREGVVVNLAAHRLYYFPRPISREKPQVITYPVSIGGMGEPSPLGRTVIIAKVEHPSWYPPASARREHRLRGEQLPAVVAPGPDNPLGEFMMRLGFGDGSYEIHGTNNPVSIGMASTYGCIGMYPEDVAALFAVVSVGTPVRLIDASL